MSMRDDTDSLKYAGLSAGRALWLSEHHWLPQAHIFFNRALDLTSMQGWMVAAEATKLAVCTCTSDDEQLESLGNILLKVCRQIYGSLLGKSQEHPNAV
eukprot:scaffold50332_cov18-Tisochrysis_lutea.AAC.3